MRTVDNAAQSVFDDILVLCNNFCFWTTEEVFVEEASLLQRIYKAEFIDDTTKNSIKEKLSKKKLTKKDKEYLEDILTSLYVSNEMFKSDKPEVKERKIKEIKELING